MKHMLFTLVALLSAFQPLVAQSVQPDSATDSSGTGVPAERDVPAKCWPKPLLTAKIINAGLQGSATGEADIQEGRVLAVRIPIATDPAFEEVTQKAMLSMRCVGTGTVKHVFDFKR